MSEPAAAASLSPPPQRFRLNPLKERDLALSKTARETQNIDSAEIVDRVNKGPEAAFQKWNDQASNHEVVLSKIQKVSEKLTDLRDALALLQANDIWDRTVVEGPSNLSDFMEVHTQQPQAMSLDIQIDSLPERVPPLSAQPFPASGFDAPLDFPGGKIVVGADEFLVGAGTVNMSAKDVVGSLNSVFQKQGLQLSCILMCLKRPTDNEQGQYQIAFQGSAAGLEIKDSTNGSILEKVGLKSAAAACAAPGQVKFHINGIAFVRDTTIVDDALPGIAFDFKKETPGPLRVEVVSDTQLIQQFLLGLTQAVVAYQEVEQEVRPKEGEEPAKTLRMPFLKNPEHTFREVLAANQVHGSSAVFGIKKMADVWVFDQSLFEAEMKTPGAFQRLRALFAEQKSSTSATFTKMGHGIEYASGCLKKKRSAMEEKLKKLDKSAQKMQAGIEGRRAKLRGQGQKLSSAAEMAKMREGVMQNLFKAYFPDNRNN